MYSLVVTVLFVKRINNNIVREKIMTGMWPENITPDMRAVYIAPDAWRMIVSNSSKSQVGNSVAQALQANGFSTAGAYILLAGEDDDSRWYKKYTCIIFIMASGSKTDSGQLLAICKAFGNRDHSDEKDYLYSAVVSLTDQELTLSIVGQVINIRKPSENEADRLNAILAGKLCHVWYVDRSKHAVKVSEVQYCQAVDRIFIWTDDECVWWLHDDTVILQKMTNEEEKE